MVLLERPVIPFHIAIGAREPGGSYPVRASTEGAQTTSVLVLPEHLLALAGSLLESGAMLPLSDTGLFGRMLCRALLTPELRALLLHSATAAVQSGRRLQLQLRITAAELVVLPWEWISIGLARPWSPALRDDYALVRVGPTARHAPGIPLDGPLQILAIGGAGEDMQLDMLEVALGEAVRAGQIELRLIRSASPVAIKRVLKGTPVHILHCFAPVICTARGIPRLALGRSAGACDLAALIAEAPWLQLVTLAGAQDDGRTAGAALPVLATTLLDEELPAVITFSAAIPALPAARFAAVCYSKLSAGQPVDLAVTAGRQALAERMAGRGWGFVQLRILPGAEQIFVRGRVPRSGQAMRRLLPIGGAAVALLAALWLGSRSLNTGAGDLPRATIVQQARRGANISTLLLPTSPSTPTPVPEPTAQPVPTPLPVPTGYVTFMTAAGDTLALVAERMGSDPQAIAALNQLDAQAPLRPERALVIPVYRPGESGTGGIIIRRGNPAEPRVALTFDIEIDDATLYGILEILRARGLHGTFFVTGNWVKRYPDAARAIVGEGHEIGNHSLTHPSFARIGLDGAAAELEQTEQLIYETTGAGARPYFRFPYGDSTPDTVGVVARQGYIAYHWSADDALITGWLAWAAQHPDEARGGILLMHGRPGTVAALPGWLDQLAALGLQPATLGEVLR